nr:photosystem I subunit VIII [Gahnia tristis]ULQ66023.1 photosystem I subunit VIII [Gahnia tristis]
MINLNLPSFFVPVVGLVFPAFMICYLFVYIQKNKIT